MVKVYLFFRRLTLRWLDSCEKLARRRPLVFALLAVSVLFALTLTFLTPVYETNDDVVISMIASGSGIGISPDEHLVFPNITVGLALKNLYGLAPLVPWYGVYLLGVHFAAHVALLYSILTWRYARTHAVLFYVCFATVGIHLLVNLQYTSTSFLVVESGVILALTALCRRVENPGWQPRNMLLAAGALVTLGSLVRWQSFLGGMAVAAPAAVIVLWQIRRRTPARGPILIPALLATVGTLAVIGGFRALDGQYYQRDRAWRDYLELNTLRLHFNDFQWTHYTPETRPVFDRVAWSETDHAMIANWFFDDETTYDAENLRKVVTGYPWGGMKVGWSEVRHRWAPIAADRSVWVLGLLLLLFAFTARNRRLVFALIIPAAAAALGLLLYLSFTKSPPARVYYPVLDFPVLLSLLLIRLDRGQLPSATLSIRLSGERRMDLTWSIDCLRLGHLAAVWAAMAVMCVGLYAESRRVRLAVRENAELKSALAAIHPRDDQLFVVWSSCFPFEAVLPLDSPAMFRDTHLLSLGWFQRSPPHQAMKERFKIDDLAQALYSNPRVELVSLAWLNAMFASYVNEHHNVHVRWEAEFHFPQFSVWKPHTTPDSGSPATTPSRTGATTAQVREIGTVR